MRTLRFLVQRAYVKFMCSASHVAVSSGALKGIVVAIFVIFVFVIIFLVAGVTSCYATVVRSNCYAHLWACLILLSTASADPDHSFWEVVSQCQQRL